jgi:hypothetical protein
MNEKKNEKKNQITKKLLDVVFIMMMKKIYIYTMCRLQKIPFFRMSIIIYIH